MIRARLAPLLLLAAVAGCGGDDDGDDDEGRERGKPVAGTFVGKVRGTKAVVAVVASPPQKGDDRREVTLYACDGRRLCAWFSGSATENAFRVEAEGGGDEARGQLGRKRVIGTVKLPSGKTARYNASRATAAAGLYNLTVSANGKLSGASAAGVALKGRSTLPKPGTGTLKLADGRRLFGQRQRVIDDLDRQR